MLLLLAFITLAAANTQWYSQNDLGDFHLNSLISRDCFRGTYGSLSLFTCPLQHVHIEPFAELSSGIKLCVIETRSHEAATKIVANSDEVQILYDDFEKYIVVGTVKPSDSYPTLCSRSEFQGAALNVITVADHALHPSTLNVLADKEKDAPLDIISDLLALVTAADLQTIDTQLAFGEPRDTWNTRNSYSQGAVLATSWVYSQFVNAGAPNVTTYRFNTSMCEDVIAEYPGTNKDEIVVLGSHLDSRALNVNSPTEIAPGADDNGSGSAINILLARLIQKQNLIRSFKRTLRLVTFCGEEQGLVGSRALARSYNSSNPKVNVVAMFNVDMVGYQPPNKTTVIAFMNGSTTPSLTTSCRNLVSTYLPGQDQGTTSACCSDQQAFFEVGYPSVGVFETNGTSVSYPDYHRSTDTPDKVSFPQVRLFAQAIYACALTAALP